jgi:hypothetical protein
MLPTTDPKHTTPISDMPTVSATST